MRRSWLKRTLARTVTVHLDSDVTIEGTLVGVYADGVALRCAQLPSAQGAATRVSGEVFVPRERIVFSQRDV